jgi:hypothetical protein
MRSSEDGLAKIEEPFPGSPYFESIGKSFDYYADDPVRIAEFRLKVSRAPKGVFYVPALALLGLIIWLQLRRRQS